ncbi:hypothetical protein C0991_004744, partial [Blastosporella zonata]
VQKVARTVRKGKAKRSREDSGSDTGVNSSDNPAKKRLLTKVEVSMKQSQLKVFRGINVPFTPEQEEIVREQFLRATISANLLFRWVEDPKVVILLLSSDQQQAKSYPFANKSLTYLIDLILATAHKKDGPSMCIAFEGMIDKAEDRYRVEVVAFCCDNDGGSQRGRKDLVLKRPWLFGPPCCAHQFQLILGEYFTVNEEAAATAEEATGLIGWVLNHGRVQSIFNEVQAEISVPPRKVLAFLVANMTRWTTHFVAFDCLCDLKNSMRHAVISRKDGIVDAQVGTERNCQKKQKLEDDAVAHCELIDDGGFWRCLKSVVDDIEPICLGTNLNQSDMLHPDQALLTFAGILLYFQKHPKRAVADGMTKRIEKWWKALDQPMFVLALVLNPFKGLSRFGVKAAVSPFTLNTILLETYKQVHSRPPKVPRSPDEECAYKEMELRKEREVSESFLSYLSSKGVFEDWEKNKDVFQRIHGDNPLVMWKTFLAMPSVFELADFAICLLGMSVNQAGLERNFSDLKIKKTRLRNWLKLPRLEKMAKIGADICASHKEAGFIAERKKRQNHDKANVAELLAIPRYANLLKDGEVGGLNEQEGSAPLSGLVKSRNG